MILEPDAPPPGLFERALEAASLLPPEEADGMEIAQLPIPVHRMRPSARCGWDPAVPLAGWAFPLFRAGVLSHVVRIPAEIGAAPMPVPAPAGLAFREAFETALGVGGATSEPCRLRIVEVPGSIEAFWLAGVHDIFVDAVEPRVLPGPEFVALIRSALEGPFGDLVRAAAGEETEAGGEGSR